MIEWWQIARIVDSAARMIANGLANGRAKYHANLDHDISTSTFWPRGWGLSSISEKRHDNLTGGTV